MRRIDDTFRVLGLVVAAVASGLAVAGFANGSADARHTADSGHQARPSAPLSSAQTVRPEVAAPSEATTPARTVRVVYAGPFGSRPPASAAPRPATQQVETAAASGPLSRSLPDPDVTGSISPRNATQPGIQLAARDPDRPVVAAPPSAREAAARPGIDLNTASIDQLNALGGGRIGKAIARGRPYASPEDLVRKRVLNRATFARISGQVTVR